jgi:hypothetical protein
LKVFILGRTYKDMNERNPGSAADINKLLDFLDFVVATV